MSDRAPAPADVEAIAEALDAHMYLPNPKSGIGKCSCRNWEHFDSCEDDHRAHVAAALLASPALATLRAHERANALRDAADELHRLWVKDGRHYGHPGCYSSGYEVWLRDRADRQEPQ